MSSIVHVVKEKKVQVEIESWTGKKACPFLGIRQADTMWILKGAGRHTLRTPGPGHPKPRRKKGSRCVQRRAKNDKRHDLMRALNATKRAPHLSPSAAASPREPVSRLATHFRYARTGLVGSSAYPAAWPPSRSLHATQRQAGGQWPPPRRLLRLASAPTHRCFPPDPSIRRGTRAARAMRRRSETEAGPAVPPYIWRCDGTGLVPLAYGRRPAGKIRTTLQEFRSAVSYRSFQR